MNIKVVDMALKNHYNTTFATKRLSAVVGGKQSFATHLSDQKGMMQPRGDVDQENINASNVLYCDNIDILKTDTVTTSGVEYKVAMIEVREYGGTPHTKIYLLKEY